MAVLGFLDRDDKGYRPVAEELDGEKFDESTVTRSSQRPRSYHWIAIAVLALLVPISFIAGSRQAKATEYLPSWTESMPRAPIGYIKQTWRYSPKFGEAPESDNVTEAQWDALVPKGQGFVREPADAAHPSAVSAVHQLHCLYSIRRFVFRRDAHAEIAGLNMEHMQPAHLRHCFDYLRQALLCHADSTLEPWSEQLGGVTGWGVDRVCRDYEQLRAWVEARRTNDRQGFIEVGIKAHQEHKQKVEEDKEQQGGQPAAGSEEKGHGHVKEEAKPEAS